ncbi:MAG TPA: RsfS/YbeB/iojap family protein [Candidatus Azoamicus sp. MARI]
MLYLVFNLLSECGMSNISVFSGDILFLDYIVLSTGTSVKHIKSSAFKMSKYFKSRFNPISLSGLDSDWVIVDVNSVLIHLMILKSRNIYDLDSLYSEKFKKINFF